MQLNTWNELNDGVKFFPFEVIKSGTKYLGYLEGPNKKISKVQLQLYKDEEDNVKFQLINSLGSQSQYMKKITNNLQKIQDLLKLDTRLLFLNKTDHHIFHKKFTILGMPINIISLNIAQPVQEGISIKRGGYWNNFHNKDNLQYRKYIDLEYINNKINNDKDFKIFLKNLPEHKKLLSQKDYSNSNIWTKLESLTEKKIENFEFVPKNDEFEIVSINFDTSNDDKKERTAYSLSCINEITKDMQNVFICLQETTFDDCDINVGIPITNQTTCPLLEKNWDKKNLQYQDFSINSHNNNGDKIIQSFSSQKGLIKNSLYNIKIKDKEILLYNIHGKYKENKNILDEFQSNIIPTMNENRQNNKITIIVGDFNFYLDHKYLHRLKLILKNENIYSDFIYTPDVLYGSNPSTLDGIIYCAPDVETNLIFEENKQLSITQQKIKENEKKEEAKRLIETGSVQEINSFLKTNATDTTIQEEKRLLSERLGTIQQRKKENEKKEEANRLIKTGTVQEINSFLKTNATDTTIQEEKRLLSERLGTIQQRKKRKEYAKKDKIMKKIKEAKRLLEEGTVQEINSFLKTYATDTTIQEEKRLLSEILKTKKEQQKRILKTKEEQQKRILETKKEQQKIKTILNTILNPETKQEDITQIFKKHPGLAQEIKKIGNITDQQKNLFQAKFQNFKSEEEEKLLTDKIRRANTVEKLKNLKKQPLSNKMEQQIQNKIATIEKRAKATKLLTSNLDNSQNIQEIQAFINKNESNAMIKDQIKRLKKKLEEHELFQIAIREKENELKRKEEERQKWTEYENNIYQFVDYIQGYNDEIDIDNIYKNTVNNKYIEQKKRYKRRQDEIEKTYNFFNADEEDKKKQIYNELFSILMDRDIDPSKHTILFENARMVNDENLLQFINKLNSNIDNYSTSYLEYRLEFIQKTEQYNKAITEPNMQNTILKNTCTRIEQKLEKEKMKNEKRKQ